MNILLSLLLASTLFMPADDDVKAERGTFALINARIETVTNGVIEKGTLIIEGDVIIALGEDIEIPEGAQVIDCEGQTIYPGLIDAGTQLGLVEVSSIAQTRDFAEVGEITPHVEALTAVNPNSVAIPVTRVGGVTTVLTQPSRGLFPGQAAMVNLHGYTPDQMSVEGMEYMMMSFPASGKRSRWDRRSDKEVKEAYDKAVKLLNDTWDQVELYAQIDDAYLRSPEEGRRPAYNPQIRALLPVHRGRWH